MSLIRNLIEEPINPKQIEKNSSDDEVDDGDQQNPRPIIKSATDIQRLRLQKLMMRPEKPVVIPERPQEKDYMQTVPTFVRNVMGSSAGAGSGEFHVYRHLRRKEYARQKAIQAKSMREKLDDEYRQKLEENKRKAEEKTAKKRAKRLKRKQRAKKQPRSEGSEQKQDRSPEMSSENENDSDSEKNVNEEVVENCENQITNSECESVVENVIKVKENDAARATPDKEPENVPNSEEDAEFQPLLGEHEATVPEGHSNELVGEELNIDSLNSISKSVEGN